MARATRSTSTQAKPRAQSTRIVVKKGKKKGGVNLQAGQNKKLLKKKKQGKAVPKDKPTQELEAKAVDVEETKKDDTVPEATTGEKVLSVKVKAQNNEKPDTAKQDTAKQKLAVLKVWRKLMAKHFSHHKIPNATLYLKFRSLALKHIYGYALSAEEADKVDADFNLRVKYFLARRTMARMFRQAARNSMTDGKAIRWLPQWPVMPSTDATQDELAEWRRDHKVKVEEVLRMEFRSSDTGQCVEAMDGKSIKGAGYPFMYRALKDPCIPKIKGTFMNGLILTDYFTPSDEAYMVLNMMSIASDEPLESKDKRGGRGKVGPSISEEAKAKYRSLKAGITDSREKFGGFDEEFADLLKTKSGETAPDKEANCVDEPEDELEESIFE